MDEKAEPLGKPPMGSTPAGARPAWGSSVGDERIEQLFRGCERRLGTFLAQMVGDRALAEDLLQDTFHDAFRLRGRLQEVEQPKAWLFAIARHRALAALRRRRRFLRVVDRLLARPAPGEVDDFELLALRDLLERNLSPKDRALLILRYLHGFEATELAAMTERSPEAVRQRLSRAKARLIAAAGPGATSAGRKESEP